MGRGVGPCGCQQEDPGWGLESQAGAAKSRGPCKEPPGGSLVQALGTACGRA